MDFDIYDVPSKSDCGQAMVYVGDVNPIHGGAWFDFSNIRYGCVDAVRTVDMCDGEGIAIEHVTVLYDRDRIREMIASKCFGDEPPKGRAMIAYALLWYGCYDPDEAWDAYMSPWSTVYESEEAFEAALPEHLF